MSYPSTQADWLDFSARLWRAAYFAQRMRRGRWAKNIARAAELAAAMNSAPERTGSPSQAQTVIEQTPNQQPLTTEQTGGVDS